MAQRKVIYVLDDDPDMLKGLGRLLTVHGFYPKLFQSADAFFASVNLDDEEVCLLLDVHLSGSSGIDVQRRLMRTGARLKNCHNLKTANAMIIAPTAPSID